MHKKQVMMSYNFVPLSSTYVCACVRVCSLCGTVRTVVVIYVGLDFTVSNARLEVQYLTEL